MSKNSVTFKWNPNFERDLMNEIRENLQQNGVEANVDVTCPFCDQTFETTAKPGKIRCPHCEKTIDLKINLDF